VRYNPFQPNGIATFGMFAGRIEELNAIEQSLFQTKNESPHHFLIQGERGIGKSSLFFYVQLVACGRIENFENKKFNFLTVSVDLNGCSTQLDIVKAIGRGLRDMMEEHEGIRERAKQIWEFVKGWEVLGVSYQESLKADVL